MASLLQNKEELPSIPDKRYFSISETANLVLVKPHVLRYWEQEFPQIKPNKRRGNRRYYQHKDVLLIRKIRTLLYAEGYTIEGAKQRLSGKKTATLKEINAQNLIKESILELEQLLMRMKKNE